MKPPRIQAKHAAGDKSEWLHLEYTIDARKFYEKQRGDALAALLGAAQASKDPHVVRCYGALAGLEEILSLLTYNEQGRNDD